MQLSSLRTLFVACLIGFTLCQQLATDVIAADNGDGTAGVSWTGGVGHSSYSVAAAPLQFTETLTGGALTARGTPCIKLLYVE